MRIYLDHNATTPVDPEVLERFLHIERDFPGNPGSLHGSGRRAHAVVEDAREALASAFAVGENEVFFVASGTEANNIALRGAGDTGLPALLAPLEHPSVFEAAEERGRVLWGVDPEGRAVVGQPPAPVGLLCLVHAQNELGTVQPLAQASVLARDLGVPLHCDGCQSLGRMDLTGLFESADSASFSGHKVGGLKGMGVLWARGGNSSLRPLMRGGGQQEGVRPGTLSPALAAATSLAMCRAQELWKDRAAAMERARDGFFTGLVGVPHRLLTTAPCLPNTAMILFEGVEGRALLPALDLAGVEASLGSACSSGSPRPPQVLAAMGLEEHSARRCVRFSFGWNTSVADAESAARLVSTVVARIAG